MKKTAPTPITLDHNEQLALEISPEQLTIDLGSLQDPSNLGGDEGHFQRGLKLFVDGTILNTPYFETNKLFFDGSFSSARRLQFQLYGQPVLTLESSGNIWRTNKAHQRLTVDELRQLAIADVLLNHVPSPRDKFNGFDPQKHAPITDLHTHSSSQLSNQQLMDIAISHGLDYPVELLDKLGIQLNEEEKQAIKHEGGLGMRFSPTENEKPPLKCETHNERCDVIQIAALTPEHQQRLKDQLRIPQDLTLSFSAFDRQYYRFVNPLVKNPKITKDLILQIARDYQRNGVKYAELSTAAMLNRDAEGNATWFKEMIEAVREAEAETGVQLRFLVGLPRSYRPAEIMAELEKIKFAARHPLIAGVDLLGYESNATSDFSATLSHIADWARAPEGTDLSMEQGWDFKRDFTIRIHAGETGKNDGNVAEAVKIAQNFGVHVRIAHALNEKLDVDAQIRKLSSMQPPMVSMEFCPSSNLAYNNVQDIRNVPFTRWLKCCQSWFLGSDGTGAIQTNPTQLALAALAGGCSLKQLEDMRQTEERFIARAQQNFDLKTRAFQNTYGKDGADADAVFLKEFSQHAGEVNALIDPKKLDPFHPTLPARFDGRRPILIAGASGESFANMDEPTRQKVRKSMRMLVAATDPQKAYFVVGRSKSDGVTAALDDAIMEHNATHPTNKFRVLALTTEDIADLPDSISWVVPQPGNRANVPDNIINFMRGTLGKKQDSTGKEYSLPGISIFIGGSNFTGDMILQCRQSKEIPYLVMENATGASKYFANLTGPFHRFNNGRSLLARVDGLFDKKKGLLSGEAPFRDDIDVHSDTQMSAIDAEAERETLSFVARTGKKKARANNAPNTP